MWLAELCVDLSSYDTWNNDSGTSTNLKSLTNIFIRAFSVTDQSSVESLLGGMLTVHHSLATKQHTFTGLLRRGVGDNVFMCGCWLVLTGSRWKYWARLGRWSVLSRSSLHPHLHRSCMRANTRPQTALDRRHQGEGNTTNTSKTNPHAFSPRWFGSKR